jgi:hypothetical protein
MVGVAKPGSNKNTTKIIKNKNMRTIDKIARTIIKGLKINARIIVVVRLYN